MKNTAGLIEDPELVQVLVIEKVKLDLLSPFVFIEGPCFPLNSVLPFVFPWL